MDTKQTKIIAIFVAVFLLFLSGWIIYRQIKESYAQDDPKLLELKKKFEEFFRQEKYWEAPLDMLNNRDVMSEISLYRSNKSYTINKEKVYICLKDENGDYYSDQMLLYVLGHEYSHVLCPEIGHTDLFHTIFEALLVKMTEAGIYDPSVPIIQNYCANGDPEM